MPFQVRIFRGCSADGVLLTFQSNFHHLKLQLMWCTDSMQHTVDVLYVYQFFLVVAAALRQLGLDDLDRFVSPALACFKTRILPNSSNNY